MMRLAANVSLLFAERPFLERFAAARAAGFGGVEFHWHHDVAPADVQDAVADAHLEVVLMNFDGGDLVRGDRGVLADPQRIEEFRANVPVALELARAVGCSRLNALVGRPLPGWTVKEQLDLARPALEAAADAAAEIGAEVLIEALNSVDNGPCLITSTAAAAALARSTRRPNVRLQFDAYHMHRMGEDLLDSLTRHRDAIAHLQVADDPGRGEPGSGEIDFGRLLAALSTERDPDWIGLEYLVSDGDTPASLERLWQRGWRELL